jgi:very-short-patch-repair endonuclease
MDLISQVTALGGVCDRATLIRLRSAAEVDRALRNGVLERDARGRYALPTTQPSLRTANRVAGVLSHRSAAHYWGWAQKAPPPLPEVTFPRDRRVDPSLRKVLVPHWCELAADDVEGAVTSRVRTLVDCMRNLPWDEAVAIVNSAIRADDFTQAEVQLIAERTKGRGRRRICEVAAAVTGQCANPFEAVLYAQALLIPGLDVHPQLGIDVPVRTLHPDLADPTLKVLIEAESFEWHGETAQLTRDCRRYNTFILLGWYVVRFSWWQVMHDPAYVQRVLREAVAVARSTLPEHANVA